MYFCYSPTFDAEEPILINAAHVYWENKDHKPFLGFIEHQSIKLVITQIWLTTENWVTVDTQRPNHVKLSQFCWSIHGTELHKNYQIYLEFFA